MTTVCEYLRDQNYQNKLVCPNTPCCLKSFGTRKENNYIMPKKNVSEEFLKIDENFQTKAIHTGHDPSYYPYSVVPPISLSTTFYQADITQSPPFDYSRSGNPNRNCLEKCLAVLDDGQYGLCFASGLGAITAVTHLLKAGDHVLCVDDVYGGTNRYFNRVASKFDLKVTFCDTEDIAAFIDALQPNTKLIWLESPTNPLMKVVDVEAIAKAAHEVNPDLIVVVDNTFLTSFFQRPLNLGADVVVYSLTKYMNGHSDVIMGAAITNNKEIYDNLKFMQNSCGIVPSPFDCFLVNRSLKTLSLRMKRHMESGFKIAQFLENHKMVEKVLHPGLPSHPGYEKARRQWSGCSGMMSFYIRGGLEESLLFLKKLKFFICAESLGGYESLVEIPSIMTHASVPAEMRKELKILDSLIRLSVGLEDVQDLILDLDNALNAVFESKQQNGSSY